MIFASVNEGGVPAWKLVLQGKKTVTRRLKPLEVGKVFAIQPGRGKKAVAWARVVSCISQEKWLWDYPKFEDDAVKEGFKTWYGVRKWFKQHELDVEKTYRIEFELITGRD